MEITFYSGPKAGQTMAFDQEQITIGREPDNTLALETDGVSRYHAVITSSGNGWSITDLGSTNGVKINGKASDNAEIKDGEKICPQCGMKQKADRHICWSCGQRFDN